MRRDSKRDSKSQQEPARQRTTEKDRVKRRGDSKTARETASQDKREIDLKHARELEAFILQGQRHMVLVLEQSIADLREHWQFWADEVGDGGGEHVNRVVGVC